MISHTAGALFHTFSEMMAPFICDSDRHGALEEEETMDARAGHILVIEEDTDLGRLFEAMLEMEGYRVTLVSRVADAQRELTLSRPDLVIFDWSVTNVAGYVWVDELRAAPQTAHIPILLVCAALPPRGIYEMLAGSGVPMIEKPFDLLALTRHIGAMIRPRERALGA